MSSLRSPISGWRTRSMAVFGWMVISLGCAREVTLPDVFTVTIERQVGLDDANADPSWARKVLSEAFGSVPSFTADGTDAPRLAADIRYSHGASPHGDLALRMDVELRVPREHTSILGPAIEAAVELTRSDGRIDVKRDVPILAARAAALLDAKLVLARWDRQAVTRLLRDSDPEIVLLALEALETRGDSTWADAIVPLCSVDDARISISAMACMRRVGGPEHAEAAVAAARLSDRAHTRVLYRTLAALGGPHAEGFLAFVVRNENDARLLAIAKQALAEVSRRDAPGAVVRRRRPLRRGHR